jgi:serine protease Do
MARNITLCLALALMPLAAHAQQVIHLSTGTGFFVSEDGHLITNNHVIEGCKQGLKVENGILKSPARVIDTNTSKDLALLKIDRNSPGIAIFRGADDVPAPQERIVVMGYPLAGSLTTQEGKVEANTGPSGEKHLMQFSNLVKRGNSGGPLMDTAGRIVGVVTAKAKQMTYNKERAREETVREMDIAITSNTVLALMHNNRIQPRFSFGALALSADRIETHVKDAVVKVTCQVD